MGQGVAANENMVAKLLRGSPPCSQSAAFIKTLSLNEPQLPSGNTDDIGPDWLLTAHNVACNKEGSRRMGAEAHLVGQGVAAVVAGQPVVEAAGKWVGQARPHQKAPETPAPLDPCQRTQPPCRPCTLQKGSAGARSAQPPHEI